MARRPSLHPLDQALLDFEADWPVWEGRKEAAIAARFDFSSQRYYQRLHRLIDDPAALSYDPMTVRRLRRRRDERLRRRAERALGGRQGT